jgi:hypothetical protein
MARGDMIAMIWKDNQDVYTLTDMCEVTVEGNFFDEQF